jgi:hypothetical protein
MSLWIDRNEVRKEQDHDGEDSVEAGQMYGRAVTKAAGAMEGRYCDCMHLIDCLTSPLPRSREIRVHMRPQRVHPSISAQSCTTSHFIL